MLVINTEAIEKFKIIVKSKKIKKDLVFKSLISLSCELH